MILGRYKGEWVGVYGLPPVVSLSIRPGARDWAKANGFPLAPIGQEAHKQIDCIDDLVCYPHLRYRGVVVSPASGCNWHPVAMEPLLHVINYGGLTRAVLSKPTPAKPRGWLSWLKRSAKPDAPKQYELTRDELLADGWDTDVRDGWSSKFVHVDELEKFEGPPSSSNA